MSTYTNICVCILHIHIYAYIHKTESVCMRIFMCMNV